MGSTLAVTTGVSIGYVVWLTRGGLLIASMVSSMPAWRIIDPIPVLASLGSLSDEEEERGDSLGSLVTRFSKPQGSKIWRPEHKEGEVNEASDSEPAGGPAPHANGIDANGRRTGGDIS